MAFSGSNRRGPVSSSPTWHRREPPEWPKASVRVWDGRAYSGAEWRMQASADRVSIAHEVSGLGSTRVVRFSVPKGSGDDGTGTVATGPENAEVQGRFEPLGAAGGGRHGKGGGSGGGRGGIFGLTATPTWKKGPPAACRTREW